MYSERHLFVFFPNPKCNQDFNETIFQDFNDSLFFNETLSMSEKALKILLKILGNVNAAGRLA